MDSRTKKDIIMYTIAIFVSLAIVGLCLVLQSLGLLAFGYVFTTVAGFFGIDMLNFTQ